MGRSGLGPLGAVHVAPEAELVPAAMTAQRALVQLTAAGVLQEATGRSRNRVWQHTGILAVLDGYATAVRRQG